MKTSLPASSTFNGFDPARVPSPCFVIDKAAVEHNLKILADVERRSGAKILLALKAFSMFSLGPLVANYLSGTCASGLHEAKLGWEEFGGRDKGKGVHTFSAAYTASDLEEILKLSQHVVFNSVGQWQRFQPLIKKYAELRPELSFGLRINPEHSEGAAPVYDPCAPGSRLGIIRSQLGDTLPEGISGLHFHTLCEQDFGPLQRTIASVGDLFGEFLPDLEWVNFGGGHHITSDDYQREDLIEEILRFSQKYGVQVYLEPGEAIAIHTGVLVSEVLDLTWNERPLAILDTSATCHMPDTLEMPYRAYVFGSAEQGELEYSYRLGGQTCLAGDVMGDYSFAKPLDIGQRLVFDDMAHYTMVKTTTFNGIGLPAIALWDSRTDELRLVRQFGYEEFKNRLS